MNYRPMVTVAGVHLPEPGYDGYNANSATFVDGARNIGGNFIGSVVGDDKAKVEINWKFLTVEQWSGVLRLFNRRTNGRFVNRVTFFAQDIGDWMSCDMYVSDREARAFIRDQRSGIIRGWTDCRIALIEV